MGIQETEQLYQQRLARYTQALRKGKPDKVPIRPFAAEFAAKYAGYTCQEVTHDYEKAFAAVRRCASDFDWDATVGNMVYVWTGLTEAIGLTYYGVPGIHVPPGTGFQYREPSEENSFMRADEYDALIADPTGFLLNTWLPRVSADVAPIGSPSTYRNNLSFLKGGMAMLSYFNAFVRQAELLRTECGTPGAISGILKAPFDILADKLRGYIGLTMDLLEQPEKVLAACKALAPHLLHVALSGADPDKNVPIAIWMHRGCVPFISYKRFESHYWATLRPVIEEIWKKGHQVLFYAEGNWNYHLDAFTELPDRSIVYHVDRADINEVHKKLGHKFCISGGIPNTLLSFGTPEEVREACKRVIDEVAGDGGYILDASAIIQDDARIENLRMMTEFTREYGVYPGSVLDGESIRKQAEEDGLRAAGLGGLNGEMSSKPAPGICIPWEEKAREIASISGDEALLKRVWEDVEGLAYLYAWHCLVSF
jgi:uroporphyrinogen-III decarboxylase